MTFTVVAAADGVSKSAAKGEVSHWPGDSFDALQSIPPGALGVGRVAVAVSGCAAGTVMPPAKDDAFKHQVAPAEGVQLAPEKSAVPR